MVTYLTGRNYSLTKRRLVSVSLATAIVISWPTKAEHISFIGGEIPYVFHQKQTGPHNEFYQHVIQQSMVSHEIKFLPYRRAMRDFSVRRADCLYVATDTKEDYPQEAIAKNEIVFSDPINSINLHAYTRLDESAIKSMSDLKGKVVAGARSHLKKLTSLANVSSNRIHIDTTDHIKAFDLLDRGRVDVVIAYEFDHVRSEATHNFTRHNFDQDFVIETTNEVVACWTSVDTTGFIKTLNAKIKDLQQNKKLEKMFNPVASRNNEHSMH
ncbi:substrate-binding periplasmic protein [Kordiimonas aquimaris]|uniref:substrate-binding periplasmic protein n=1 Tax=Kordiimonas aquimaris TaxID=707591 RepID=UPI0021D190C5|nr:transporter substrate-binding domain-containing protein [Kordiimonas aquimaris]